MAKDVDIFYLDLSYPQKSTLITLIWLSVCLPVHRSIFVYHTHHLLFLDPGFIRRVLSNLPCPSMVHGPLVRPLVHWSVRL